jgi:hypothetical protein
VTSDIFDVVPISRFVYNSHSYGIGSAGWVTTDVNESGDGLALEYEGIDRCAASLRAEIEIGLVYDYCYFCLLK